MASSFSTPSLIQVITSPHPLTSTQPTLTRFTSFLLRLTPVQFSSHSKSFRAPFSLPAFQNAFSQFTSHPTPPSIAQSGVQISSLLIFHPFRTSQHSHSSLSLSQYSHFIQFSRPILTHLIHFRGLSSLILSEPLPNSVHFRISHSVPSSPQFSQLSSHPISSTSSHITTQPFPPSLALHTHNCFSSSHSQTLFPHYSTTHQ